MKKYRYLLVIVALLSLAGWTGYAREQRTNSMRQTWEYRVDSAPTSYVPGSADTLKYVDSKKSEVLLNQRGAEGWELVGVGAWLYYFKRAR
jgi:hypothetical protein